MTNQPQNKSVKNIAEIAKRYMYKMEVVYIYPQKAFLSISDNFLRSPYPRHMTSNVRSAKYVESIYEQNN